MVVLFTVDEGKSVVDLFTPANITSSQIVEQELTASDAIQSVVSPLTVLQWTRRSHHQGRRQRDHRPHHRREPDPDKAAIRQQDAMITTLRLGAAGKQDMSNPEWVKFLIFGNDGFSVDAAEQTAYRRRTAPSSSASRCRRSSPTPGMRSWPRSSSATRRSTPWRKARRRCRT